MIDLGIPARGRVFIRHIQTDDRYAGGKVIIPEPARDKIAKLQFEVVAAGMMERCDDDDCERELHQFLDHSPDPGMLAVGKFHFHEVGAGDWVLCRHRSWDVTPDPSVYVVKVDDILGKFVET